MLTQDLVVGVIAVLASLAVPNFLKFQCRTRVAEAKIASKGIKSVRSRVANISEFLDRPMEMGEFRELLLKHIFAGADSGQGRRYLVGQRQSFGLFLRRKTAAGRVLYDEGDAVYGVIAP